MLKIPLPLLKLAKRSGCTAFNGAGRVRLAPLLEWVFSRDDSVTDWAAHGKKFDALLKETQFKRAQGEVINRDHAVTWIRACMATMFSELDRKFVNELPPNSRGREAIEIRGINQLAIEQLKARLLSEFEKLIKEEARDEKK